MADPVVPPIVKKNYGSRLTLDLDTSLPDVKPEGCLSLKNVIRRHNRGLAKRPGAGMTCSNEQNDSVGSLTEYLALHNYSYETSSDTTTIGSTEELIVLNNGDYPRLFTVRDITITVTYTGAGTNPTFSLLVNSSGVWECTISVNGSVVSGWPKTYGNGFSLASGTVQTFISDIDSILDWTCIGGNATTNDNTLVAQIGSVAATVLTGAPKIITLNYKTTYSPVALPTIAYQQYTKNANAPGYRNIRGINAQNCMYLPFQDYYPIKYDGHLACRPGLPRPELSSIADAGAGATHAAGNEYIHRIVFWRVDNRGNQIYGPYSDDTLALASHAVGGAPTDINVIFYPLARGVSTMKAFDPRSATVNGNQVAVTTLTVTAGHSLAVGDVIYFLNRATGAYVEKTLTATAATTVTFSGAVDANNGDVLSNIRIQIQRTENGGIDFFEVANIPNNAHLGAFVTQTYVDNVSDANLGAAIEDQTKLPEPPPGAKFVCIHQGLVVYAGLDDDPNGFTWNDPEWGLEAFPSASHRDRVAGGVGSVSGIISENDNVLAIFKENRYFRIQGDLAARQYTVNEINQEDLGVASNASIVKTSDGIRAISNSGPVLIRDGQITLAEAEGVLDFFDDNPYELGAIDTISANESTKLVPRRATGVYWDEKGVILYFIPAEEGQVNTSLGYMDGRKFANDSSLWLCYDLQKKEWREWEFANEGINAHLSMETFKGSVYFISTNYFDGSTGLSTSFSTNYLWRLLPDDTYLSYVDNVDAIEWSPTLQWESLGFPSSEKKMTEVKLYARHTRDFISAFDVELIEYRNNDESTEYTHAERTFSAATDKEKIINPVIGDFESNAIKLYNANRYECPVLSGFELAYRLTTSPEIKDTKGD